VDYSKLASNFLDSPDGVLASDHYMRGKLSYPFTVVSPSGLLQVAFQSVDPSDYWIRITGIVPPFDESKINKIRFRCKKSGYFTKPVKNITNGIFICHKQVNNDTKSNSYSLKRQ